MHRCIAYIQQENLHEALHGTARDHIGLSHFIGDERSLSEELLGSQSDQLLLPTYMFIQTDTVDLHAFSDYHFKRCALTKKKQAYPFSYIHTCICPYTCTFILLLVRRSCSGAFHFSLVDDVEARAFFTLSDDVSSCMYVCVCM